MLGQLDWDTIEERLLDHYPSEIVEQMLPKLKKIDQLRKEKKAIILAHYYQILPIQLIADICGDSLALAMAAKEIKDKDLIISSTVHFMAEMIKLLSPEKKVIIPDLTASCSIAEGINASTIRRIREAFPEAAIVGYINTTAAAKAEMDAVCTSANAAKLISRIQGNPVILLPDSYFAENIFKEVSDGRDYLAYRRIESRNIVLYDPNQKKEIAIPLNNAQPPELSKGTCIVHEQFKPEDIPYYKKKEGIDLVLAHPEVKPEVAEKADMVGGTGKMIKYVGTTKAKRILYLTECDLAAPLIEAYPDRQFITPCILCPYMKKNSVDKVLYALEKEVFEVNIDPKIAEKAKKSLQRMFELTS